jgi:hypothetical protein
MDKMRRKNILSFFVLCSALLWMGGMVSSALAQEGLYLKITTDSAYRLRQPVNVTFTVFNETGSEVTVTFGGCQRSPFNLRVYDEEGNQIWDTADCLPCVCPANLGIIVFPTGEFTYERPLIWDQVMTLACQSPHPELEGCGARQTAGIKTGLYYLVGRIFGRGVESDPVEIEITK